MPLYIPKVIFRDTLILWTMLRTPRTLGDAHRSLSAKTKSVDIREYVGRIDFLASRNLVELSFTYSLYHPFVNLTDEVPDGYVAILAKVKSAHKFIFTTS